MVPKTAYPPTHNLLSLRISPSRAQKNLTTFLTHTQTHPHLHPDSHLSTTRITFSSSSGPTGGLALHHLQRIAAGLRGENLLLETSEELARFFDTEAHLPAGDDAKLDGVIAADGRRKRKREVIEEWAESSSVAGAGDGEGEVESFVNTPRFSPEGVGGGGERERAMKRAAKKARRLAERRAKAGHAGG